MRALKNHFICCGYVFANRALKTDFVFNSEGGDLDSSLLIIEVIMHT